MAMKKRPAKDIKPTDLRSKALQEAKTAKTKRLAAEMKKKATAQAADKKVGPAKDLNKGGTRAKFLKDAKSGKIKVKPPTVINKGLPATAASRLMKLGSTAALAATFYLGDTFSTKTGGAAGVRGESDRQTGPLFSPSKNRAAGRGNPKTVNPYRKASSGETLVGVKGGKGALAITLKGNPDFGGVLKRSGMTGTGRLRPEVKKSTQAKPKDKVGNNPNRGIGSKKADDYRKMQQGLNSAAAPPAQTSNASTSAAPKQPKGMTFQQAVRRNVTEEYTKKKMKPKGNLLGLLRKRKG